MNEREKIISAIEKAKKQSEEYAQDRIIVPFKEVDMILALLKEQEAMEQCLKTKCVICLHCDNCDVDENGMLKEQEWKLITEDSDGILHGLPGDDGTYLMTDGKDIWIDEYVDGVADGIFLDSGRDIRDIKAWMYMPELPEQKGGEIG